MKWSLTLVTGPTAEPISLTDAKMWLRLDHSAEDDLVSGLIQMVREAVEERGISVFTQTWDLTLDYFPHGAIDIPKAPLQSITSVKYTDTDGVEQTLAASAYQVDTKSGIPRVAAVYGTVWPSTRHELNAVTVRFVAGYGTLGATPDVPERILQAMRLALTTAYAIRSDEVVGAVQARKAVDMILANYELYL
jgi:uncharacterized phiE125 gp8 family phage protein